MVCSRGNGACLKYVRAYVHRLAGMLKAEKCDLLWIEKEVFPWLPAWFDSLLFSRRATICP